MKFIIDNWHLMAIVFVSGSLLLWPILQSAVASGIEPSAAVQLINRQKAVVVDVSDTSEFASGHVAGSKSIPISQLEERLATVVKNKNLPLILVCQSGARSIRALAVAKKLGYEQAQSLGGGLAAWKAANLPIEKA
ncbi:MAG: rhodanese-like domain-containing protein [Candidatus Saccharibacteria bacterium]|nr:rhodanese-like domain-containing protein [Rhodoferax sp.]